ncbi:hypothetical protein MXMO3_01707 [Maritalea myrionectae]|uniref:Major capsid protein n=1 Tax=Maritalea myrionectae TaxID=454601 RepID=A0A2R4ME31_9HYPH|nr:phage capsid protein [Maritalea myrionectae]AVX04233.1 hypothetical protein MXMO3_01707 [Maritalea myrionectae]
MSVEAAVIQYRKEMVAAFAQRQSMLRMATTKEMVIKGNQATFLVAGNATDRAITRGANGNIPYNNPTNSQVTATLEEKHAPYRLTGFNVFASQGDQDKLMRNESVGVINRDVDLTILDALSAGTVTSGTGAVTLAQLGEVQATLGEAHVPIDDQENMFAVVSPKLMTNLRNLEQFSSADYVEMKPLAGPAKKVARWYGFNWIVSSLVDGLGTNSETCYFFHRDAIGYAGDVTEDKIFAGYNEEQGFSWSRAEVYHGSKLLQNSGVVKYTHDATA